MISSINMDLDYGSKWLGYVQQYVKNMAMKDNNNLIGRTIHGPWQLEIIQALLSSWPMYGNNALKCGK